GIDAVIGDDGGQQRRVVLGLDQVADGDFRAADAARNRRLHIGVVNVQARLGQRRLGGTDGGIGHGAGVGGLVIGLKRNGARLLQAVGARQIGLGQRGVGARLLK